MKKGFSMLCWIVLFIAGILMPAFSALQGPEHFGKVTIPKEFELDTAQDMDILPQGEYLLSLYDERLSLAYRKNGIEIGYGILTEVEKTNKEVLPPQIDLSIVKKSGADHVQISVFSGRKVYRSLLRCAMDAKPEMLSPESLASLDPQIVAELDVFKEALSLLDRQAATIWPNWTEYKNLEFSVVFPNRTKLIVTAKERMPSSFKQIDYVLLEGKKVFINRSKEIPGRIGPITGWHGGGGGGTVSASLTGAMVPQKGQVVLDKNIENLERFSRMMMYVHEAFHSMQRWRIVAAELKGLRRNPGMLDRDFVATIDFSLYSEIEGEALIKAFGEPNNAKALDYFKDFLIARKLKLKEMSTAAAAFDAINTSLEGLATYSACKMAMLVKDARPNLEAAGNRDYISAALARAGDYLDREMKSAINRLKGETLDVNLKHYVYGAYWCMLLDRFFPAWKQGFFENPRSLDEATADLLKISDATEIAGRLKTNYEYETIKARHTQVIKERDDAIASIANRRGKTFLIDLKHAQRDFDIKPRQFFDHNQEQLFPRGLVKFIYGSLKLKSEETPMRLIYNEDALEWIDTDIRPGEKGYNLKYKSKEGDLYSGVSLTTKGFSMTAKAIKITEDGNVVRISIWD